ncbi:hypothetical protein Sango_1209600 [Sesamum angolense]|uniref:Uncharacterized protein n=1 Tax=Sesamum angolense TaxID=2727404 RepID=A0AAE1WWN8_9LAMI|nr:hypothetical protein Sango_1209600 [Sesamum angolense]
MEALSSSLLATSLMFPPHHSSLNYISSSLRFSAKNPHQQPNYFTPNSSNKLIIQTTQTLDQTLYNKQVLAQKITKKKQSSSLAVIFKTLDDLYATSSTYRFDLLLIPSMFSLASLHRWMNSPRPPVRIPRGEATFCSRYVKTHKYMVEQETRGRKYKDVPIYSADRPTLTHDFAVTKSYAIFPDVQIVMNLLDSGEDHQSELIPVLERIELAQLTIEKLRINVKSKSLERRPLCPRVLDFAVINPAYAARKTR